MTTKQPFWVGEPGDCDGCSKPLTTKFTDGKAGRAWGNFCPSCVPIFGVTLGLGRGQQYEKQADGRWLKTGG